MAERDFQFHPVDRQALWKALALTMSQAASLTGVSERQIQHWMDRGYISPAVQGTRKINGECLDVIILIREARAAGIPLRQAVDMAQAYLRGESPGGWGPTVSPALLRDLRDKLHSLQGGMDSLEEAIGAVERGGRSRQRR